MQKGNFRKPDFLIIGAQKSGTTWLWRMLNQHPETDLPKLKEIHYFGSSENYNKGNLWYYKHFEGIDPNKITGEASTSYLFDYVPFWYNASRELEIDARLPSIPDLVKDELKDVKLIVILRNPIHRAISAYKHIMRRAVRDTPSYDTETTPALKIEEVATRFPKKRILEYGFYARYLKLWFDKIPRQNFKIFIFEQSVIKEPEKMVSEIYDFLEIDSSFSPNFPPKAVNKSWGWTRILSFYYLPSWMKGLIMKRGGNLLDRYDFLKKFMITPGDLKFLRRAYAEEKVILEDLLQMDLPWNI